jgi:subtilisin family serine protease
MSINKLAICLCAMLILSTVCTGDELTRPRTKSRAVVVKTVRPTPWLTDDKPLAPPKKIKAQPAYVVDELLVQFADAKALRGARALNAQTGATVLDEFTFAAWQHLRLPKGLSVKAALARYGKLAGVVAVQPNYVYSLADTTPNDPSYGLQYAPAKIQAPLAWDTTTGSSAVVVAIIDTGVRYTHEDLSANMWRNPGEIPGNGIDDDGNGYVDDVYGIDTVNKDSDPNDDFNHGTHVAGIVGAVGNNALGVAGVNWNVRLMALKMFDQSGNGTSATAIAAFQYVIMMKRRGVNVRVTNNSWGGAPEAPAFDQALKSAFDAAAAADILNVCAAGNGNSNNDTTLFYPASYDSPNIVAVAASDESDNRAGFSNYGATLVDLAAPGVNIFSTMRFSDTSYGNLSGTSMASPMVAGAAALVAAHDSSLSALSLKATLLNSVDVLPQWSGLVLTGGRLNVARALQTSITCSFNATPTSAMFTESGGTSTVNVTATAGCNWVATSNAAWLTINSGASGTGTGAVGYTVAVNNGAARTGTLVVADQIINITQAAGAPPPDPTPTPAMPGQVLISEFRLDGPQGPEDQFVELYNNTEQPFTVWADDNSGAWALVSNTSAGGALTALCTIPNGTTIPARGHYLYTPAHGYSLLSYGGTNGALADATGPAIYTHTSDAPFAGLALFRTSNPANWTQGFRLDAVGGTLSSALLREGAGLAQNFAYNSDAQYSWARTLTTGVPQDTNDNAQDFTLVASKGVTLGGLQPILGAPGPENLASPIQRNAQVKATLIDTSTLSTAPPNRVRDFTPVTNGTQGTLIIRRKFKNSTGAPVSRLRFRIVDITTLNTPNPGGAQADLRAIDSADVTVTTSGGSVLVKGTTLEQPPAQTSGGGLNSTLVVALANGALANGASVNVQLTLGVQANGRFRFLVNVEALP